MKKGRFSLAVATTFLLLGFTLTLVGVLSFFNVLPEAFNTVISFLLEYTSLDMAKAGVIDFGVFLILEEIIIYSFRLKMRFS